MRVTYIPAIAALLPAVGIHLSYLVAASVGHVPWCVPYLDNCTPISATGRQAPESFVFRATIIPTAVLIMVYWTLSYQWLKALASPWRRANRAMVCLGVIACFGLLLYTTVLGATQDEYRALRRLGTTVFFGLMIPAQIILTLQLNALSRAGAAPVSRAVCRTLGAVCVAVVAVGAASFVLAMVSDLHDDVKHAVAWISTMLICLHIFVTGRAWHQTGFTARFLVPGGRHE